MLEDSEKLQEEKKNRQALESELQKQIEERKEKSTAASRRGRMLI